MLLHFLHLIIKIIYIELKDSNFFDKIYALDENFLEGNCKKFCEKYKRGYGYWIWKSYIILKLIKLKKIKEGDIVLYLDGGCRFNKYGVKRFKEYINLVQKHNFLSFHLEHLEKYWTRKALLKYFNTDGNSFQIMATIFMFKFDENIHKFIKEWYCICKYKHGYYLRDIKEDEDSWFKGHRHDQSIFSLLVKKYKFFHIKDETNVIDDKIPIQALRLQKKNEIISYFQIKFKIL